MLTLTMAGTLVEVGSSGEEDASLSLDIHAVSLWEGGSPERGSLVMSSSIPEPRPITTVRVPKEIARRMGVHLYEMMQLTVVPLGTESAKPRGGGSSDQK